MLDLRCAVVQTSVVKNAEKLVFKVLYRQNCSVWTRQGLWNG